MNQIFKRKVIAIAIGGAFLGLSANVVAEDEQTTDQKEEKTKVEKIRVVGSRDAGLELSSEKILKVPGAGNDPIRAIESLPGVVLARGFAPAVRGSSPNDMYYQSDDVPIGNVFHNDSFSTFHPNLIQSFELKTGAWEAEYSDAIGGVIDTKLRDPEFTELTTTVDFSFLRAGILVESQLTDDSAFYLAMRQSLVHLYIENILDDEDFSFDQAPINNDYQFKYVNNINSDNKLTLQATGSNDDVALLFSEDSDEIKQNPDLVGGIGVEQYYHNQAIVWTNYSSFGETKTIFNRLERSADLKIGRILDLDAITTDYLFKVKNNQDVGLGLLSIGGEYRVQNVDYTVTGKRQPCNNEFEVCPPSYYSDTSFEDSSIDIGFLNAYADYDWELTDRWSTKVGVAVSYNDYTEQTFVEPRITARYSLTDEYQLKLAYGQHHQWFRQYKYLSEKFGSKDLELSEADHYVLGLEYEGESDWAWRIETYYKDMRKLIVSNPNNQTTSLTDSDPSSNEPNYVNDGVGEAYGVELLINKAISNNWYGWLSVAYSKTERVNELTGEEFSYQYDLPWIVNLVSNYEFSKKWQLGLRWRYESGNLYTPIDGAAPVYPLDENNQPDPNQAPIFYDPIEAAFNSDRLEDFHRLDVRLDYQTTLWGNETNIYFEVLNLYGQKSVIDYEYNADYSEREERYQFPEMPLPSIGIQIIF